MTLNLVTSTPLVLTKYGFNEDKTMSVKQAHVSVDIKKGNSCRFVANLEKLLVKQFSSILTNIAGEGDLQFLLYYGTPTQTRPHSGYFTITDAARSGSLLGRLATVCGSHQNIKANIQLEFGLGLNKMSLALNECNMTATVFNGIQICGYSSWFNFTDSVAHNWHDREGFPAKLTFSLEFTSNALNLIYSSGIVNLQSLNRMLLENAITTGDTVIMTANQAQISCHKVFLMAQSPVFNAMFNSGMREDITGIIEMPDITEIGVTALLAYLYYGDVKTPLKCSFTAVELLRAAEKYEIANLYKTMTDLILDQDKEWFSVNSALQLILPIGKLGTNPEYKQIESKAISVLKSKSPDELNQCTEFQELFKDSKTGREMAVYFLQNAN